MMPSIFHGICLWVFFLRKHNVTPGLQEFMNFPWRDPLPDNLFACGTEVLASILGPVSHE